MCGTNRTSSSTRRAAMSASAGFCGLAILLAVAWSPSVADAGAISAHGGQATQVAADGARRSSMAFMAPAVGPLGSSQAAAGLRSVCPTARLPLPAAPTRKHSGVATLVAQYRGRGGRGRGRGMRQMPVAPKGPPMDNDIQFSEMRVVVANPDGKDEMLGVMTKEEALAAADERGVNLVLMSPDAVPPVCKIINYDKLRYENEKKEKMKKKNQKSMDLKEVKLSYKIDVHDYDVRKRAAKRFLIKGDKVKASIRFKGREMAHRELAQKTLLQLCADCEDIAVVEKKPMMEGRMMQVIMAPNVEALKAAETARENARKTKKKETDGKKKKMSAALAEELGIDLEDSEDSEDSEDDDVDLDALNAGMDEKDDSEEDEGPNYDLEALSQEELGSMITVVGDRIRVMKEEGASKDVFGESVDELLALKARYQEIAGAPWTPPVKA